MTWSAGTIPSAQPVSSLDRCEDTRDGTGVKIRGTERVLARAHRSVLSRTLQSVHHNLLPTGHRSNEIIDGHIAHVKESAACLGSSWSRAQSARGRLRLRDYLGALGWFLSWLWGCPYVTPDSFSSWPKCGIKCNLCFCAQCLTDLSFRYVSSTDRWEAVQCGCNTRLQPPP